MAKWILKRKKANIKAMSEALGISPVFAQVLVNRGINTKRSFRDFITPSFDTLEDVKNMKDVVKAFDIVRQTILEGKKITVYGDYDVDGVMSTAILVKGILALGGKVGFYIPHRQEEGYGLNISAVEKIKESGTSLLILCDNGISAIPEIDYSRELGIKVIVIDHHEPAFSQDNGVQKDILPRADALVDPKQSDCNYAYKQMCAGGLCYRFIKGLFEYNNIAFTLDRELLILASLATFCDIVDLTGENRVLAYYGLEELNKGKIPNIGLKALIKEKKYEGKKIDEFAVGFIIGPCINASGRLESAAISAELMLTNDEGKAYEYAKILAELNDERKAITTDAFDNIFMDLDEKNLDKVIVVFDKTIHESVAGIVAGRVKERFHRPSIVITGSEGCAKGSGRSIAGYNMFEALLKCKDLFLRFGGHAMAAGFSLEEENIEKLRQRLNDDCNLTEEDFEETINVDMIIGLHDATFKLYDDLYAMRPFGKENKEPLMGTLNAKVIDIRMIDEKNTIIFTFEMEDLRKIKGITFGKNDKFKEMVRQNFNAYDYEKIIAGMLRNTQFALDVIYYLTINEYNNDVSMQLNIKDFRLVTIR